MPSRYGIMALFLFHLITKSNGHPSEVDDGEDILIAPRVVGGWTVAPYLAPFVVYVEFRVGDEDLFGCSGVLISLNFVLTAGHCLMNVTRVTITLGAYNIDRFESSQVPYNINLRDIVVHPTDDIGLVRLPGAVKARRRIQPVKLPSWNEEYEDYTYHTGRVYGWGRISDYTGEHADRIRFVRVMILPPHECPFSNRYEICTLGTYKKGTCEGDSGGPLMINDVLVGITTHGPDRCEINLPSYYLLVNRFLGWIENKTDIVIARI